MRSPANEGDWSLSSWLMRTEVFFEGWEFTPCSGEVRFMTSHARPKSPFRFLVGRYHWRDGKFRDLVRICAHLSVSNVLLELTTFSSSSSSSYSALTCTKKKRSSLLLHRVFWSSDFDARWKKTYKNTLEKIIHAGFFLNYFSTFI